MVLEDLFSSANETSREDEDFDIVDALAAPVDRLAATVADLVLFLPLLTLVLSPFARRAKEAQILGNEDAWKAIIASGAGAGLIALILYQTVFVAWKGGTPGKLILKLRVVSAWEPFDRRVNAMEAFLRALTWSLELCLCGLPWLAVFSNDKRRPIHDRISDTAVISLTPRRRAGPPSLAEISVASGFQSSALAVFALAITLNIGDARRSNHAGVGQAKEREEAGQLCADVREALEETSSKKSGSTYERIQTALALHAVDALDKSCLSSEADFALWKNENQPLAYLAKGLSAEDEALSETYRTRACKEARAKNLGSVATEICAMGEFGEEGFSLARAKNDDREFQHEREVANEKVLSSVGRDTSLYLKIKAVRALMEAREFARAIELMEKAGGPRKVAGFFASERAKAFWSSGRVADARVAMTTAVELVESSSRVELSRWFCFNETFSSGCSADAKVACGVLGESVRRVEAWLMKPEVATAYVRAQACDAKLRGEKVAWDKLEDQMPSRDGKALVRALAHFESAERTEGVSELRDLIARAGDAHDAFAVEAQLKLVELAATAEELRTSQGAWEQLSTADDGFRPLGQQILKRLTELRAWDQALAFGLKLSEMDPSDARIYQLMVVAAHGSGQKKMAHELLENAVKMDRRSDRRPASLPAFEEAAKTLLREGRK